jgi:hypothetical protein
LSEGMTLHPSGKITTSGRQPQAQMSIAFLLDNHEKTKPIDSDGTQGCCDSVSMPSQMPVAFSSPRIPTSDQFEMNNTLFDTTLTQPDLPCRPYGHYPPEARNVRCDIEIGSPSSGDVSRSGTESFGYDPVSLSNDLSTSFHQPSRSVLDVQHSNSFESAPAKLKKASIDCPESLVRTSMWTGGVLPFFVSVAKVRGTRLACVRRRQVEIPVTIVMIPHESHGKDCIVMSGSVHSVHPPGQPANH